MHFLVVFLIFTFDLVAAETVLIKSIDAGKTWIDINAGSTDPYLASLQIDRHTSALYALTYVDFGEDWHLSVSMDGGQTWQLRQSFPKEFYGIIASAAPSEPDTVYLASELIGSPRGKVMISKVTNHGETMERYIAENLILSKGGFPYDVLASIQADPHVPETLFALVTRDPGNDEIFALLQGVWVSVDSGRNWARLEPPVANGCLYPQMQIDPSDSSLYVTCGNELFVSADKGATWTQKIFPAGERLWHLQFGPGSPAVLYGDRGGGVWRSVDGGNAWKPLGALPASTDLVFLTAHPTVPDLLFASTTDGIAKSEDGGVTWTAVTESSLHAEFPLQLLIDPQMPDTFYLMSWKRQHLGLLP